MKIKIAILLSLVALYGDGLAQGFMNFNFESANLSSYGAGPAVVPATSAIPGWTAYINGSSQTDIYYNTLSLGAPQVNIEGTNSIGNFPPIQGKYFILLQGDNNGFGISAGIGQMGQIPAGALSLIFLGQYHFRCRVFRRPGFITYAVGQHSKL